MTTVAMKKRDHSADGPVCHYLTYPGDVTESMHPGQQFNAFGQRFISNPPFGYPLEVAESQYFKGKNKTLVRFRLATLPRS